MLSRRKFLAASALGTLTAVSTGCQSTTFTTADLELVTQKIKLQSLPTAFDGYRIGFISDLHYGPFVPDEWITTALSYLKAAQIDLLLLGGDHIYIPESTVSRLFHVLRNNAFSTLSGTTLIQALYSKLADLFQTIKPPDGIYGVHGNHDRWTAPQIASASFEKQQIKILVNQTAIVQRGSAQLKIVGVDDYWTGIPELPGPSRYSSENELRILLAHNPDYIAQVLEQTSFQFQLGLAGHTHGGQIKLPGIGALTYNVQDQRFRSGLYQHPQALVYTTRGIGVVEVPYRINCRPEVTILVLRKI